MSRLIDWIRVQPARVVLWVLVATGAVALPACGLKDSDYFALIDTPALGSITVTVFGAPAVDVSIMGPGTDESRRFDGSLGESHRYPDLAHGTYSVRSEPGSGFVCAPELEVVTIGPSGLDQAVTITCTTQPLLGSITFTTSGLTGTTAFPLALSGAANLTGQLGATGLGFDDLTAGTYDWTYDLGASATVTCAPLSGSIVLDPGATYSQAITCTPAVGTLSVSVLGATASIAYSGPSTGGGVVGATPMLFPNLPVGTYTVSITDPTGFTCLPSSSPAAITAGTTTAVQFECMAVMTQPTMVELQFNAAPGFGGQITMPTFMLPVLDGGMAVGTVDVTRIGTLFSASGPDRFGGFGEVGIRLDVRPVVSGSPFITTSLDVCVLNSSLNAGNPAHVTMRDAGLVALGISNLELSPSCFNIMLPSGTRFVDVTGPVGISYDFSGIRLRR